MKFHFFIFLSFYFACVFCKGLSTDDITKGKFLPDPAVENILVKSPSQIQVIFAEDMASEGLTLLSNYRISGSDGIDLNVIEIKITDYTENRILDITTGSQSSGLTYTLNVVNIKTKPGKSAPPGGINAAFAGAIVAGLDTNPPELLAPVNDRKVTNISTETLTLAWGAKVGATSYTVEVARDDQSGDTFSTPANHIAGSPFTVIDTNEDGLPENTLIISIPDPLTYKWRVRADTTTTGLYSSVFTFHGFDDAVYVFCPAPGVCDDTGMIGNKSRPFQTIQKAISSATVLNLKILVAIRDGSNTAYGESISFLPGTKLYGGFDGGDWYQGPVKTKIESAETQVVMIANNNFQQSVLDFFNITNLATTGTNYAVYSQSGDNNVKIQNCIINAGGGVNSYGIYNNNSSPEIFSNTIDGGSAGEISAGIANNVSSPHIAQNSIQGGSGGIYSYAIYNRSASSPTINDNILEGGSGGQYSAGIDNNKSASRIFTNKIDGGTGGIASYGIVNYNASSFIANNSISGGNSGMNIIGIDNNGFSPIIHSNNISGGIVNWETNQAPVIYMNHISGGIENGYGQTMIHSNIINGISLGVSTAAASTTIIHNTINSFNMGIKLRASLLLPIVENNLIFIFGSADRYGIYEDAANSNPDQLLNNLVFDSGTGGTFTIYADFLGNGTGNCLAANNWNCLSDSINTTSPIDWSPAPPDNSTVSTGNLALKSTQSIGDVFQYYPADVIYTRDSADANTSYDGTTTLLEVIENIGYCDKFIPGQFFEYFYDNNVYTIDSITCNTGGLNTVSFTPAMNYNFGPGIPVLLWNTANTDFEKKYSLNISAPSPALNNAVSCPAQYFLKNHAWGDGTSQADCDNKFPYAGSTYNGGNCTSAYLFPPLEIPDDGIGNDNGLCESGESCLQNDNIGAYAGHGNLTPSGCDVSGILAGITLKKFESNGY